MEKLTDRERLALDLEHTTENLWVLVDRCNRVPFPGTDAPTRGELADLVDVLRRLDTIGANLAHNLYRPVERRRGPLDVGAVDAGKA
ncbi:MAG: hypothetical protein KKI08_24235 [Armatimonadetes bacterium]|nr:hypothetical protein [Armatimonadota bacterium]